MSQNVLDTSTEAAIYNSISTIFGVSDKDIKDFLIKFLSSYVGKWQHEIDLSLFYNHFDIDESQVCVLGTTFNHVTTRISEVDRKTFQIHNLEHILLSENPLTLFLRENELIFYKDIGIHVLYRGNELDFEKESWKNARLRKRLTHLSDSCVNGFLFPDNMPHVYVGLTGMPEILSDLFTFIDRHDLKQLYFNKKKCYVASCYTPIENITFDGIGDGKQSCTEKSKILFQYAITYLIMKLSNDNFGFENPMVRIPDSLFVDTGSVINLKEILSYKEIFQH